MSMDTIEKPDIHDDTRLNVDLVPYEDNDDPNLRTHIVNPPANLHIWTPGMSAQDIVDTARLNSWPVTALCGFTWVPKHNPEKYDACSTCMDIAQKIMSEMG